MGVDVLSIDGFECTANVNSISGPVLNNYPKARVTLEKRILGVSYW